MKKRILSLLLSLAMVGGMLPPALAADEVTETTNLARLDGVTASASSYEAGTDFNADKARDGDTTSKASRWATDNDGKGTTAQWLQYDLGDTYSIGSAVVYWEKTNVTNYTVETSADGETWATQITRSEAPSTTRDNLVFSEPVDAQYIRLSITAYGQAVENWYNVGVYEFEVYGTTQTIEPPEEPASGNLCRPSDGVTVTATASAIDAATHGAANAIDGDMNTRWASETAASASSPQWLQIDLGTVREVSVVVLHWEQTSVLAYTLQVSENGTDWSIVHECTSRITKNDETITFDKTNARYIKVNVTAYDNKGSLNWPSVSLWEVEVYKDSGSLPADLSGIVAGLEFGVQNGKVVITSEVPEGITVDFAANLEQVVGPDGTIYTPLVDTQVELDVTVSDGKGNTASSAANAPVQVTIPGTHSANDGNEKPAVIPEIAEWYSSAEQLGKVYTLTASSRIIAPAALNGVANELKADIKDLFGLELNVVASGTPAAGDIVLAIGSGSQVAGFDNETYRMEVTGSVTITATDPVGAYWGTRSVLQALKLSGNQTIAQGTAHDYPEFRLRSFTMDVGRKPISMDMLEQIVKNMAWYKLNDFHVHLNDNLIFMEDYGVNSGNYTDPEIYAKANDAYSAFRLESDLEEEADAVAPLAAKDYHYTKAEFKQFTENSAALGVSIVPEIDVPAHAKAITDAFPSLRLVGASGHPWNDHLDLTNKYDESLDKVKEIFDEYIDGGVFGSTVHFGADEYYDSHPTYRHFVKDMISYLKGKDGVTPRVWGSLSYMSNGSDYKITSEEAAGVQMDIWNTGWANPQQMYNLGFDLINVTDGPCYMVPNGNGNRGGYGDYLNLTSIYSWTPNCIGGTWLPASSSQILGGAFAIWQDNIDTRAAAIDEVDSFVRFFDTLPVISVKMWGEGSELDRTLSELQEDAAITGYAPGTNPVNNMEMKEGTTQYFNYKFDSNTDSSGNGRDLTLTNAERNDGALELKGGASYAELGLDRLGWNNKLSFRVKKTSGGGTEQIIFEGDHAYGSFAIKALPIEDDDTHWKLGFSRELYDFEFDVELPVGEWVTLTLYTSDGLTQLCVDNSESVVNAVGAFLSNENSNTPFRGKTGITHSSFQLPLARIGSKTNAFVGLVDDVYAAVASFDTPVDDGDYDIPITEYVAALDGNHQPGDDASKAIDGDNSTVWHTVWSSVCPESDGWIQIELEEKQMVSSLRYLPRPTGTNGIIKTYDILVSDDGENWTTVKENGSFRGTSGWMTATFPAVEAKFVRLLARDTYSDGNYRFVSAAEIRICRTPDLSEEGKTVVTLPDSSFNLVNGKAEPEPVVTFADLLLEKDKDYTLSYQNNTTAGTGTVIITGKGMYTGSVSATFTIVGTVEKIDLSTAVVTLDKETYTLVNGKAEPLPTVTLNGVTLEKDKDYTLSYQNNTAAGTGTVIITGKGMYTGSVSATFTIVETVEKIDLSTAVVTLDKETYTLVNGKADPLPTVTLNGVTLEKDKDYTVSYRNNTSVGTGTVIITGIGGYTGTVSATFTIKDEPVDPTPPSPPSTITQPSGGTVVETGTLPDGAELTTTTDKDTGAVSAEAKYEDGTVVTSKTTPKGSITAEVSIPEGVDEVTVTIPTNEELTINHVAIIVHPDGSEEIVKTSAVTEGGLQVTLTEGAVLKVVDNGKTFADVSNTHWAKDSIAFVTSRGIFNGTGSNTFTPNSGMSRAMVCTVMANLAGVDVSGGSVWYEKAVSWAKSKGLSDGANPTAVVTREQLATMLYRYAGSPEVKGYLPDRYTDGSQVSGWARTAMIWAIENHIINGRSDTLLAPKGTATRAEVAAIIQRSLSLLV